MGQKISLPIGINFRTAQEGGTLPTHDETQSQSRNTNRESPPSGMGDNDLRTCGLGDADYECA